MDRVQLVRTLDSHPYSGIPSLLLGGRVRGVTLSTRRLYDLERPVDSSVRPAADTTTWREAHGDVKVRKGNQEFLSSHCVPGT